MADDNLPGNDDIDIDALVNEVEGGGEDSALADEWASAMEESGDFPGEDVEEDVPEAKTAPLEKLTDDSSGGHSPDPYRKCNVSFR